MEQKKQLISSTNRSQINSDKVNLSVSISKIKKTTHELAKMYDFKKYMDSSDMNFPEEMDEMIPKDTPPYLDNGEHYVERIGRALKFFKQCALIGPSGTGKTLTARAVANRTDACFIRVIGSELVQRYVGEGARMVRELFDMARKKTSSKRQSWPVSPSGTRKTV